MKSQTRRHLVAEHLRQHYQALTLVVSVPAHMEMLAAIDAYEREPYLVDMIQRQDRELAKLRRSPQPSV